MPSILSPGAPSPRPPEPRDFSHLLRPEIYHPLSQLSVPPPFRNSPKQPSPDTPIPDLLARGHYRAAAIAAAQELTGSAGSTPPDPTDYARILGLLHVRLACLTLSAATPGAAAQEARALGDLGSSRYYHSENDASAGDGSGPSSEMAGEHLAPWPLRVLVVRLQAAGFADPRRAVMSYYDLAGEARARVAEAAARGDNSARELWRGRLAELGVRVAGALVEMDDLVGAAQHLRTLRDNGDGKLGVAKALLWLHLGDVDAARGCVKPGEEVGSKIIAALCAMADGEYGEALSLWRELKEDGVDDEMVGVNAAVCLLYLGKMQEVSTYSGGLLPFFCHWRLLTN